MHDTFLVEFSDSQRDLNGVKFDNVLGKAFLFLENLVQLTTADKGHDEVETGLWLEQEVHTNQVGVVCSKQNIFLQQCGCNLVILQQDIFANDFYREHFFGPFQLGEEDFTESAPAQLVDKCERF